jgi:hypothetical protein
MVRRDSQETVLGQAIGAVLEILLYVAFGAFLAFFLRLSSVVTIHSCRKRGCSAGVPLAILPSDLRARTAGGTPALQNPRQHLVPTRVCYSSKLGEEQ